MGSVVVISTSRDKLYSKNYKRDKFVKLEDDQSIPNKYALELLYQLLQNKKIMGKGSC